MRMQTRLNLAATGVIAVVAISIGSASVFNHFKSAVSEIDGQLQSAISTVSDSQRDPITAALEYTNHSNIPIAVTYIAADRTVAAISGDRNQITSAPSKTTLEQATHTALTIAAAAQLRIKTLSIGDGEYLVFTSSLAPVLNNRTNEIRLLILAVLIFVTIGVLILSRFIHRDLSKLQNLIASATEIADGETNVSLPEPTGNSEVDELTVALGVMIGTLQKTVDAERDIQKSMQNFLGDASHELRTPLTVIKSYFELIRPGNNLSEDQTERAQTRVKSQIDRMEALIGDLLLLAELGERRVHSREIMNLSRVIQQGVDDFSVLHPTREVISHIDSDIYVDASGHLLDQLLANAFSNINRHTPEDSAVEVTLHDLGDKAVITIEDSGPGLPSEVYERGITHFQRFDQSRSRQSGGAGLGMSIMAAIVEENQGFIELFPSKFGGLGTRFILPKTARGSNEFAAELES